MEMQVSLKLSPSSYTVAQRQKSSRSQLRSPVGQTDTCLARGDMAEPTLRRVPLCYMGLVPGAKTVSYGIPGPSILGQ